MKRDVQTNYLFNVCKIDVTKLEKSILKRLPPDFVFTATWDTFENVVAAIKKIFIYLLFFNIKKIIQHKSYTNSMSPCLLDHLSYYKIQHIALLKASPGSRSNCIIVPFPLLLCSHYLKSIRVWLLGRRVEVQASMIQI